MMIDCYYYYYYYHYCYGARPLFPQPVKLVDDDAREELDEDEPATQDEEYEVAPGHELPTGGRPRGGGLVDPAHIHGQVHDLPPTLERCHRKEGDEGLRNMEGG